MNNLRVFFILLLIISGNSYAQNYIFNGTGNAHIPPYAVLNDWKWDSAAYKKFVYTSPVDKFKMPYRLLTPPNLDPTKKYPLFIMLHGGGEGAGTQTDLSLPPNTAQMMWGAKVALDSINKYPAYILFPQTQGAWWGSNRDPHYSWNNSASWTPVRCALEIIEKVLLADVNKKIDKDRIYLAGLSIGGRGAWEMLERRPDLFAATSPFSGMGDYTLADSLINNPIWNFQGGQDNNPAPWETQYLYDTLVKHGGNPKRSEYVDRDHWSWVDAYRSKDWMQWVYSQNKRNIHVLFGSGNFVCPGSGTKLGISSGFLSYQWQKDGVNIPGATAYVYEAKNPGTYSVTFKRRNGELVNSFPLVLTSATLFTPKPVITLSGTPALNAGDSVTLIAPAGQDVYFWSNGSSSQSITVNKAGKFYLSMKQGLACTSSSSDTLTVSIGQAPGLNSPSGLTVVPYVNKARLNWKDNSDNETGFEIMYTSEVVGWKTIYLGVIAPNTTSYVIPDLISNATYYEVRVRAINKQGYSGDTPGQQFTTLPDTAAPTPVTNLTVTDKLDFFVTLKWNASKDNDLVRSYDIYQGTNLVGSSDSTGFRATGLTANTNYTFTVKAKDKAGNTSAAGNVINVTTLNLQHGIKYSYYEGNWPLLPNFNNIVAKKTGTVNTIDVSPRKRDTQYALKFDGSIYISTAGVYTFYTNSDDGSKLYINGQEIVNNNYLQTATERAGTINLTPGLKVLSVTYFQQTTGTSLIVSYQGPASANIPKQVIPLSALYVIPASNILPIAYAGPDRTLALPQNSLVLTGSGTDADGIISSYAWTQQSGPVLNLGTTNTSQLALTGLAEGTYIFRLAVSDNNSGTAFDDVKVLVKPTNQPPLVSLGPDADIYLPLAGNTSTLSSSASDPDGGSLTYLWSKVDPSPNVTLTNIQSTVLTLNNPQPGAYTFRLTVTDEVNISASDDIIVTVHPSTTSSPITSLVLANADLNSDIATLINGYTLDLANGGTSHYTIVARTDTGTNINSISFSLDYANDQFDMYRIETAAPYSFSGNCYPGYNCYNAWWVPQTGSPALTATPYSGTNGTGSAGIPLTVYFNIINSGARMAITDQTDSYVLDAVFSPNPAKDQTHILFSGNVSGDVILTLTDAMGKTYLVEQRILNNSQEMELDLSGLKLSPGMYFVRIAMNGEDGKIFKLSKE